MTNHTNIFALSWIYTLLLFCLGKRSITRWPQCHCGWPIHPLFSWSPGGHRDELDTSGWKQIARAHCIHGMSYKSSRFSADRKNCQNTYLQNSYINDESKTYCMNYQYFKLLIFMVKFTVFEQITLLFF